MNIMAIGNFLFIALQIVILFSVLILGHELGHFTLAKINGVKVEEFSFGMGMKVFGFKGKETEYNLRLFPIGGFVKMLGEEGEVLDNRSFSTKSPLQRLSIIAAGPIMNFILAIVLFSIYSTQGFALPVVSTLMPGKPAEIAGLKQGDKIININGKNISTYEEFASNMYIAKGNEVTIGFIHDGKASSVKMTPVMDKDLGKYIIGISPVIKSPNALEAVGQGFTETGSIIGQTLDFFKTAFMGKASINDVGGPVTIIKVSSEAAKQGIFTLIWFAGVLSVSLAVFNIIPFPALDGGWIFLLLFEIITRKRPDPNKVGFVNYIGFMILIGFMVLVTIKDIFYPIKF